MLEQHLDAGQLFRIDGLRQVVRVDDAVHRGEVGIGFHGVGVAGQVHRQLVDHGQLVGGRVFAVSLHLRQQIATHGLQLGIGFGQMLLLFFEYGVEFLIEFGSFMLVFQRCSSISFVGSGDYTLALRKKGACSRQVPFLYNKDAPERRTLPIFPDQRSITCEHRYRYRQGSARGHLVRTRERHLLHHREKIRAVQRRLQLRRVQDMAGGHDAPGAIDENADVLETYNVHYIYVSDYERAEFDVDLYALDEAYELIYANDDVRIYDAGWRETP